MEGIKKARGLIILADDSADMRELVGSALPEVAPRIDLVTVNDGDELVRTLTTQAVDERRTTLRQPTIVLLDVMMPIKGGFEALEEIRRDPLLRRVPVIGFTVSDSPADITHMYDLGVNAFLTKPAGYDGLRSMLARIVAFWFETAHIKEVR